MQAVTQVRCAAPSTRAARQGASPRASINSFALCLHALPRSRAPGASFLSMRELSAMPFDQLAGMVEQGAAVGLGGMAARLGAAGPRRGWDRTAAGVEQALPRAKVGVWQ